MMIDNQIWNELAYDAIYAAANNIGVKDFELQCRLAPIENGKSYFDRIRVVENLIRSGFIQIEDDCLSLSNKPFPPSLISELKSGSQIAWKIFSCFDETSKYANKVDFELLKEIGNSGEYAVVSELSRLLPNSEHHRIKHISLFDDSVGFDIHAPSVKNTQSVGLLEIKTSPRPGSNFTFFISQNEVRVASQNKNWFLIGVVPEKSEFIILGHINFYKFSDLLPVNVDVRSKWETAKVTIPKFFFDPGLP